MVATPEHDKLKLVVDRSQSIGEFLQWMQSEKKIRFAKWSDEEGGLLDAYVDKLGLLSEFFNIDQQKLEMEKRAILEEFRQRTQVKP